MLKHAYFIFTIEHFINFGKKIKKYLKYIEKRMIME